MTNIRAICFDLDDTLWDLGPVILRAEQILYEWFAEHYPRVATTYTPAQLRLVRQAAVDQWPELKHDLTELRLRVLRQIARETGYDDAMVSGAYEVFFAARNDVTLFDDVVPVLQELASSYRLIALSNGNADLDVIGISRYFDGVYGARELGVAKPDGDFFVAAAAKCEMELRELVHVGDHPQNDIVAAREVGMRVVWLNRDDREWPAEEQRPEHEIAGLAELSALLSCND